MFEVAYLGLDMLAMTLLKQRRVGTYEFET